MSSDVIGLPDQWSDGELAINFTDPALSDNSSKIPVFATPCSEDGLNYSSIYCQFRRVTDHYSSIHGYAASVFCLLGIPANMAIIVVLTRPKMVQSSTNQILIWLAVSDLMTMASFLPIAINFYVMKNPGWLFPSTVSWAWISYLIFAINSVVTWHTIAIWLTISLAIFRCIFICYPTRGQELCSRTRANISVGLVFFWCILLCVPNYFLTEVYSVPLSKSKNNLSEQNNVEGVITLSAWNDPDTDIYRKMQQDSDGQTTLSSLIENYDDVYDNDYYYSVRDAESFALLSHINFWIQALLFKLLPCILLTALTCFLISAMREARRRRCKLKSQGRRDESDRAAEHQRTTAMLLAIVGLFLVTEFPQGLLTLLSIFLVNFHHDYYQPLGDILDIAALLNNSINFVLYCGMSSQFRETFAGVFLNNGESCKCLSSSENVSYLPRRIGCQICLDLFNKRAKKEITENHVGMKEGCYTDRDKEMEKML